MKSEHADKFNHDSDAVDYDEDVKREEHPIRAGYEALLQWVADEANIKGGSTLDLGCGTGNLSLRLNNFSELTCVDISEKMVGIAREKLKERSKVSFELSDLLQFFEANRNKYDSIVSTYAIHHLTEDEKKIFFESLYESLNEEGVIALGDLMFKNSEEKKKLLNRFLEEDQQELVDDINDEFFWNIDSARNIFEVLGGSVEVKRFSDLSWGLRVIKCMD